jgi:hypothetical protein
MRQLYLWKLVATAVPILLILTFAAVPCRAQENPADLQQRVDRLEKEVADLKAMVLALQSASSQPSLAPLAATPNVAAVSEKAAAPEAEDLEKGTTLSVDLDTYYQYNLNRPVGGVNLLRAYDVLSNSFNLSQAGVILERPADLERGRRVGGRLDLQFGQATETLQGNPANEPRPNVYRNIFQAYGTFLPTSKLSIDFGKWASFGVEGNYTKDQINYSRSFYFYFLPFYHFGLRTNYQITDRFSVNYWLVNGTNQSEATNSYKDEAFGFTAKPSHNVNWTTTYYLGQENPDRIAVAPTSPIPVQPGLSFEAITPAPDGRLHIFDTYATWQATSKLLFATEDAWTINRIWRFTTPAHSSAPFDVGGGAVYAQYQLRPKFALGVRGEYMRDNEGLFSGIRQTLKEGTVTFDRTFRNGFLMRYEIRHDWSNQPTFLTRYQGQLRQSQTTATAGLVWWFGGKSGAW